METVLITGGAGFIGSHLCNFLLDKNFRIICIGNLITGNENNIRHLLTNKNFRFINHDVIDFKFLTGSPLKLNIPTTPHIKILTKKKL